MENIVVNYDVYHSNLPKKKVLMNEEPVSSTPPPSFIDNISTTTSSTRTTKIIIYNYLNDIINKYLLRQQTPASVAEHAIPNTADGGPLDNHSIMAATNQTNIINNTHQEVPTSVPIPINNTLPAMPPTVAIPRTNTNTNNINNNNGGDGATTAGRNNNLQEANAGRNNNLQGVNHDNPHASLTEEQINKLTQPKLKEILKSFGIKGLSSLRVGQMKTKLKEVIVAIKSGTLKALTSENIAGDGFPGGAYWKLLSEEGATELVEDWNVAGSSFRPPTYPASEHDANFTVWPKKYNYNVKFDRPPYLHWAEVPKMENGMCVRNESGSIVYEKKLIEKSTPNNSFMKKHDLNENSHPAEWFEAFLPWVKTKQHKHSKTEISLDDMCTWTYDKSCMANAGKGGSIYQNFTKFSVDEIQQHLGIYFLNGLMPSPNIENKFYSTKEEGYKLKGNDFCHLAFGGKSATLERRHR